MVVKKADLPLVESNKNHLKQTKKQVDDLKCL